MTHICGASLGWGRRARQSAGRRAARRAGCRSKCALYCAPVSWAVWRDTHACAADRRGRRDRPFDESQRFLLGPDLLERLGGDVPLREDAVADRPLDRRLDADLARDVRRGLESDNCRMSGRVWRMDGRKLAHFLNMGRGWWRSRRRIKRRWRGEGGRGTYGISDISAVPDRFRSNLRLQPLSWSLLSVRTALQLVDKRRFICSPTRS